MNPWSYVKFGFDPVGEGQRESLCTLGNGYFATRGATPESHADDVHYPGTYIGGVYNRLPDEVAGTEIENESLVNVPNWLPLTFAIEDGDWFDLSSADIQDYCQELNLKRGVLIRRMRVRDAEGRTTRVTQRRFVHMENRHLAGLQTAITAEDWSGRLRIRSALDGSVRNSGVPRYEGLADRHLRTLETQSPDAETIALTVETNQSHIRIAEAARTQVFRDGEPYVLHRRVERREDWIGLDLALDVAEDDEITIEKVVSIFTGRDRAIADPMLAAVEAVREAPAFDVLLDRHVLTWDHLWGRFGIDLDGSQEVLQILRLHLFHVLQTVSPNTSGLDVGVPARGLHGEAYRGHILWDELFVLPLLTLRLPDLTRSLLQYRYWRLPAARRAARAAGYHGAMYPWQSGSDGREESQRIHLNPLSGEWVPDVTFRQRHIGIAVAYNIWHYYQATGDLDFLASYGAETIFEIARFFADLTEYDHVRDRYVIRGVMGPDEFHTGYPDAEETGIDNNAYTNVMATWLFMRALDALEHLRPKRRTELVEKLGLQAQEWQRWEDISRRMYVPFHDGVISQFEGYEKLDEFDWTDYGERYGNVQRLDRILGAEGDTPNRYKVSKQADVLMLIYLLADEEIEEIFGRLGYPLEHDTLARTVDYYLARTSHGSTLSALVHAWALARTHRGQVVEYFLRTLESDIQDIQGGTTREGVHLAAMAGSVDLLQRCFAGLDTREETLWFHPRWPAELGALEFAMQYRRTDLTVRVTERKLRILAAANGHLPIKCGCAGQVVQLIPGESVELSF